MEPTLILAIRHGETAWNVDARIQGQLDIALNPKGHWQAQRLARALATREPIHAIYSSDLSRAFDTAGHLAQATGQAVISHQGLRERGFGIFEGHTFAEIAARWPEQSTLWRKRDPHWAPQGGESLETMRTRVQTALHELAARHPGQLIALVSHGGVMDLLYRAATQLDLAAPRTWQVANAAVNRLLWTEQSLTLIGWSDTSHLDEEPDDDTTA